MGRPRELPPLELNADSYAALDDASRFKYIARWMETIKMNLFPTCIPELGLHLKEFLKKNFAFTYSSCGKRIVYARNLDVPGTVWEELPGDEDAFEKLQGRLRAELMAAMMVDCGKYAYTVYLAEAGGEVKVEEHVPEWVLYTRAITSLKPYITGQQANVMRVQSELSSAIEAMRKNYEGNIAPAAMRQGLQDIPRQLRLLDKKLDEYGFLFRKDLEFPNLTNDPDEDALAFFDLSTIVDGPTPAFDSFLHNVEPCCIDSLKAAIYASFYAKSHLNQYIWMHGEGGDGKTSLTGAVSEYAGMRLTCAIGQNLKSDFVLENAIDKRLLVFSDVKSGLSIKSTMLHNITGHDAMDVNRKGKPAITRHLDLIVWVAANDPPQVNFSNDNEVRRLLYIKTHKPPLEIQKKYNFTDKDGNLILDPRGKPINNGYDLKGKLIKEMPHILFKCREAFERVSSPEKNTILMNDEQFKLAMENCIDIEANSFEDAIGESFEFGGTDRVRISDIHEEISETMRSHGERRLISSMDKKEIIRMLTTKYGCTKRTLNGVRYLEGLRRKGADEYPRGPEMNDTVFPDGTELL